MQRKLHTVIEGHQKGKADKAKPGERINFRSKMEAGGELDAVQCG